MALAVEREEISRDEADWRVHKLIIEPQGILGSQLCSSYITAIIRLLTRKLKSYTMASQAALAAAAQVSHLLS
jgi:hypothetical protein